ncbi:MAG: DNA cytosine methyltransferase [Dehalococcoidia bacterium]
MALKCIDLFSGAGGLSCGLHQAGFDIVLGSDNHPAYSLTYRFNHPDTIFIEDDIRHVSTEAIFKMLNLRKGELDLLAGGPPCQGFSINAPSRSPQDQRNHLFREFLRFAEALLPKVILIENVTGIMSFEKGIGVRLLYSELGRLGYRMSHKVLFAAHYGVPQIRYRTIFIATCLSKEITFPQPSHYANGYANFTDSKVLCLNILPLLSKQLEKPTTVWDAISDLPGETVDEMDETSNYRNMPTSSYQSKLRNGLKAVHNHVATNLAPINQERLKYVPQGGNWRNIPFNLLPDGMKRAHPSNHTKRYGRLNPNGLCSTILTKCDPHWGSFIHPFEDRVLSVREAARIQSFPDSYVFRGSKTHQYEQVGNAVPPLMAKCIGHELISAFFAE